MTPSSPIAIALTVGATAFLCIKCVFSVLAWWHRDTSDSLVRKRLDFIHDELLKDNARGLIVRVLHSFSTAYEQSVFRDRHGLLRFSALSALLNVGTWAVLALYAAERFMYPRNWSDLLSSAFGMQGFFSLGPVVVMGGTVGVAIDLLAAWLTRRQLARAVRNHSETDIDRLIVIEIIGTLTLAVINLVAVQLASTALGIIQGDSAALWRMPSEFLDSLRIAVQYTDGLAIPLWILGASLPTAVLALALLLILLARFTPRPILQAAVHVVYLVSSDDKSLLVQGGTLCAGIAALLAGVAAYVSVLRH